MREGSEKSEEAGTTAGERVLFWGKVEGQRRGTVAKGSKAIVPLSSRYRPAIVPLSPLAVQRQQG
jgi:hypothetical protein